jgi:hypothetical protein
METTHQDDANGALMIGELPELRTVPLDDVVLHEDPDMERVTRLLEAFSADGVLRNPAVVGRVDGARRIVLDGANRIAALRRMGCRHVLVQEVDLGDTGLTLESWHHAIEHLRRTELLAHASAIPGVVVRDGRVDSPLALARYTFADGSGTTLAGSHELLERVEQLRTLTALHHRVTFFDRVSYTDRDHLQRHYRSFTALMSFPRFTREDLVDITRRDRRLPSGITRVLLPKRALRFNLQLQLLLADLSTEEKDAWLQQNIREKVTAKAVRFYREPTFVFDE